MAISYPLALPSREFITAQWDHEVAVVAAVSPTSFARQVQNATGQRWSGQVAWGVMPRAAKAEVMSFIRKLNGPFGTFLMGVPGEDVPRGSASTTPGSPVVDGATQTGSSLVIKGLPISTTGWLLEDDLFQLGTGLTSHLHVVLEDVDSNGSGEATMTIWPELRVSPGDLDSLIVSDAKGLFSLVENKLGFRQKTIVYEGIGFSFVEAL